ncbi:MAG TPA: hypothetical protein VG733_09220 [Chthoniobacteraceae bacterium]|nr:hypothetical protein [Chthoniobacteraceae bacterium]
MLVLLIEIWIFLFKSKDSDLNLYQVYGHASRVSSLSGLYNHPDTTVEYPPLAISLALMTDAIAQHLPDCSRLGRFFSPYNRAPDIANFKLVFRLEMALVTFLTFLLVIRYLKTWMPLEASSERFERLLTFVLSLLILNEFIFDKLDILVGALLLLFLVLMSSRIRYIWSFAILAFGIAFKFVPIIAVPLGVLGSLPSNLLANGGRIAVWMRVLPIAIRRGLLVAALTVILFVPFLLIAGPKCLAFLTYHKNRGIQCESSYAGLLGILKYLGGLKVTGVPSYGSCDLQSSLSPLLASLSPGIAGTLLVGVTLLLFVKIRSVVSNQSDRSMLSTSLGRLCHADFSLHLILLLLVFIFSNKVFSTQYVLWLVPLAPLVPFEGRSRRLAQAGLLFLFYLTTLIARCSLPELAGKPQFGSQGLYMAGPAPFAVVLIVGRTIVLAGLIGWITFSIVRWRQKGHALPPLKSV